MSAGDVKAGGAFVELFVKGLSPALGQFQSFGAGLTKVGAGIAAIGAGIVGPMVAAVAHFTAVGAAIDDVAQRTSMAREEIMALKFAAEQSGTSLEVIEKALIHQRKLGITKSFDELAEEIAAIPDPNEQMQRATEVWGKAGAQLIPMVANLKELKALGAQINFGITGEDIENAGKLDDAYHSITSQLSTIAMNVGAALAPTLLQAAQAIAGVVQVAVEWVANNRELVLTIAAIGAGLVAAGTVIVAVGGGITAIGLAIAGISAALPILAAIAFPLFVATAAAVGLAVAIGAAVLIMYRFGISAGDVARSFLSLSRSWVGWLFGLGQGVKLIEMVIPHLRTLAMVAGIATSAFVAQGQAAIKTSEAYKAVQAAISKATAEVERINEALEGTVSIADQIARTMNAAFNRRQRLVEQFATPDERADKKEQEILAAIEEVKRSRNVGMLTHEEAVAEQRALYIALARHRANEAERRAAAAERGKVANFEIPKEAGAEQKKAAPPVMFGEQRSSVATSAAAKVALTFGGGGPQQAIQELVRLGMNQVQIQLIQQRLLERIERKVGNGIFGP